MKHLDDVLNLIKDADHDLGAICIYNEYDWIQIQEDYRDYVFSKFGRLPVLFDALFMRTGIPHPNYVIKGVPVVLMPTCGGCAG